MRRILRAAERVAVWHHGQENPGLGGALADPANPVDWTQQVSLCPNGYYYDATHAICVNYPPAEPLPGFGQGCPNGYAYDQIHGVCQPYPLAYPQPFYPR